MNLQRFVAGAVCWFAMICAYASEADWIRAFDVMWETRWREDGPLIDADRWPNGDGRTLKYSFNAKANSGDANRAREALALVTSAMGFTAREVAENASDVQLQFEIRPFDDNELSQGACYTQNSTNRGALSKVRVVLSDQHAYKCVLHELMHAMGFPGHPSGDSVLSYFEGNRGSLKPIDKFMLKSWYTDAIQPDMPAITAARTLNRLWIEQNVAPADLPLAREVEKRWFSNTIAALDAYAFGKGEPPRILYRSGRLSTAGMNAGLMAVQTTLANAYFNGLIGEPDVAKSAQLLLMSAQKKNRFAADEIAFKLFAGDYPSPVAGPLCEWLKNTPTAESGISTARLRGALDSDACTAHN